MNRISKHRQMHILVVIAMIFCAFAQVCFSQEFHQKVESGERLENMINIRNTKKAKAKRKFFWVAGGFWGFFIWILLVLNAILFCCAAITVWWFIRRHRTYPKELVHKVKSVLYDNELGFVMETCSSGKTPLARILFSTFKNIADGFEICRDEMKIALKAEYERMLKTTRLLLNCAVYSFVLGWLGLAMVLVKALNHFSTNVDAGNWQELAYSCSQSFYPLIVGFVIAYIAFWFYQYCLGKINRIIINTEKIAYDLIKILRGINMEDNLQDLPTMTRLLTPQSIISLSKNKIISPKK